MWWGGGTVAPILSLGAFEVIGELHATFTLPWAKSPWYPLSNLSDPNYPQIAESLRSEEFFSLARNSTHFVEPAVSSSQSLEPAISPYEPDQSSSRRLIICLFRSKGSLQARGFVKCFVTHSVFTVRSCVHLSKTTI
jgi:hypothetical protein